MLINAGVNMPAPWERGRPARRGRQADRFRLVALRAHLETSEVSNVFGNLGGLYHLGSPAGVLYV